METLDELVMSTVQCIEALSFSSHPVCGTSTSALRATEVTFLEKKKVTPSVMLK